MEVVAGAALKRRRDALGLSLRDVAVKMNRPNSYTFIRRLEIGERMTCTTAFAEALALVLQRDVDELFMPRVSKKAEQDRPPFRGRGRAA